MPNFCSKQCLPNMKTTQISWWCYLQITSFVILFRTYYILDVMYMSTLYLWRMFRSKKNVWYNLKKIIINIVCVCILISDQWTNTYVYISNHNLRKLILSKHKFNFTRLQQELVSLFNYKSSRNGNIYISRL